MAVAPKALPVRVLAMSPGNPEPPKAVPLRFDFTAAALTFQGNLEEWRQQTKFQSLRSIYYNLEGAANNVVIVFPDSQQRMTLYAGKQGYRPVLVDQTMRFEVTGVAGDYAIMHLLNIDMPAFDWPLMASNVPGSIPLTALAGSVNAFGIIGNPTGAPGAWQDTTRLAMEIAQLNGGNSFTGLQSIGGATAFTTISNATFTIQSDGTPSFQGSRYTNSGGASFNFQQQRARGTIAAPTDVIQNDFLANTVASGYGGGAFRQSSRDIAQVIAPVPGAADMEGRRMIYLAPAGSVTPTEIFRLDHATGLSMFGANVVIGPQRGVFRRGFTFGTLPAAGAGQNGAMFRITDGAAAPVWMAAAAGGGAVNTPVWCNGAAWLNG